MIRSPLRRRLFASTAIAVLAYAPAPTLAQATTLPDAADGAVLNGAAGGATIGRGIDAGTGRDTLTVAVDGNRPVIEWTRFGVGADQTARFTEARTNALKALEPTTAVLNRVTGRDLAPLEQTQILGRLESDPTIAVYLTNPQGVLFGPDARVSVGSLVATTLSIDPAEFQTTIGQLRLSDSEAVADGTGTSSIAVEVQPGAQLSTLGPGAGARIALIGAKVISAGTLDARNIDPAAPADAPSPTAGTVALVAATDVNVSFDPQSPLTMTVAEGSPLRDLMTVAGTIKGASVLFAAATERTVRDVVLGIDADVEATTAVDNGSGVLLVADRATRTGLPVTMDLPAPSGSTTPASIAATLGGTLTAGGAGGAVRLYAGSIRADGVGAIVDGAAGVSAETAGDLAVNSVTTAASADLRAGGALQVNSATAGLDLTLGADTVGGLALDGAGDPSGARLTATDGTVSLTASGPVLLGDVLAGGDVGIGASTVTTGNVTAGRIAAVEPGADRVRIEATETFLRTGDVTVREGGADLRAAEGVQLGDVAANAVRVEAGHALTAGTLTARAGNLEALATGRFSEGGTAGGVVATRVSAAGGSVLVQTTAGGTIDLGPATDANAVDASDGARLIADGALTLRGGAAVTGGALEMTGTSVTLGDGTPRVLSASGRLLVQATDSALTGGEGVTLRSGAAGDAVVLRAAEGISFAGRAEAIGLSSGTPGERTGDVILHPGDGSALRLGGGASGRSLLLRSVDGTATGQLLTGGNVTLGSVDVDRSLTIGTSSTIRLADVTVTAGDLTLSGVTVNATGTLAANTVTAQGDGLVLRDVDSRGGETALLAAFGATAGTVTGTGVVVRGDRDIALTAVDARTGLARVEAGRAVAVAGLVQGTGAQVTARAGLLRLGGADARTGALTLRSDDGAIETGPLAGTGVEARAADALSVGVVDSGAGVTLVSDRGSVIATGAVTADTGIGVTAASDVELSAGGTTDTGDLALLAGQVAGRSAMVRAGGPLAATTGTVTLTGADGISVAGVRAGGNTTLDSASGAVTSGALAGAIVTASGRTGVGTGAVTATADAQLTSLGGRVTTGNVQAATGVLVDGRTGVAAGDVAGGTGRALLRSGEGGVEAGRVAGRGVEVTAFGTIGLGSAAGGVEGGTGSVQLTSEQGSLTVRGQTAGVGVFASARDGVVLDDVAAGAGEARLSSGAGLDTGNVTGELVRMNGVGDVEAGLLSGGDVSVISAAGIVLGGAEATSGSIVLDAEDDLTVSGPVRAALDVGATGGGALQLGEVGGRDVTLRSRGAGIVAGDVTARRLLDANATTGSRFGALTAEAIRMRVDTEGLTAGDVLAASDLQVDTIGDLTLGRIDVTAGRARLESRGGSVGTGAISTRDDVAVQGATGIAIGGAVTDTGSVLLDSGAGVTSTGRIRAPGTIRVEARTAVSLTEALAGTGGLTIRSASGMVEADILDARGDADVSGRTGLMLGSVDALGALNLAANNGDARLTRASAGGTLTADAGGLLAIGAADAGGTATLASGSVTLGTVTAPMLDVTARGGNLSADDLSGRGVSLTQRGVGDMSIGRAAASTTLRARVEGSLLADRLEGATIDAAVGRDVGGRTRTGLSIGGGGLLLVSGATTRLDAVTLTGTGDVRAGELDVAGNVAAGGDLTLRARGGATLGAVDGAARSVAANARLTLIAETGAVTGRSGLILRADAQGQGDARDLTVSGGNGIAFAENTLLAGGTDRQTAVRLAAGAVTDIGLDRVEARALTAADGNATLTHNGAIRAAQLSVRASLSLRAEGSGGTIALGQGDVSAGGATLFATGDVALDRLVTSDAVAVTSAQGDIGGPSTRLVSGGVLTLRADAASGTGGAIRLASATATGDATFAARTIAVDLLATAGSLSADTRRVLAAPADQSIAITSATASGDATIRAGGALSVDTLAAGGTLDASAVGAVGGRTSQRTSLTAERGALRVTAGGAVTLGRGTAGTDLSVVAASLDATSVNAGGGAALTTSGAMTLGTASAGDAAALVAGTVLEAGEVVARSATLDGGTVTVERADAVGGDLTLTARLGAARAALARARDALTMNAAGDATIGTANAGDALRVGAGGVLRADDLTGASVATTANSAVLQRVAAGSGGLDIVTAGALQLEQAMSQGNARLSVGTDAMVGTLSAAGDIVAEAGGLLSAREIAGTGVSLTGDAVTVGTIGARGALSVTARTGDVGIATAEGTDLRFVAGRNLTLGRIAATGVLQAGAGERLNGTDLRGTTVSLTARNAELAQVVAGSGGLDVAAGESLRLDQATVGGTARVVAGTDAALGTLAASGNVVAQAGNLLAVESLSGDGVTLSGGTLSAEVLTARGPLVASASAGDLGVTMADGADIRFAAARDMTLGRVTAAGLLQATAGRRLAGADLRGTTVSLTSLNAELAQVAAGTGGLDVAAGESLRLDQATSGGTATVIAGTNAVLGTLAAAGNVVAQAGNALTVGRLSGDGVVLTAGTVSADSLTARGPLAVTAQAGGLSLTAAQGVDIRLTAERDMTLGQVTATGLLQAGAGERLTGTDLRGANMSLSARNADLMQVAAGAGGLEIATGESLRLDQATSDGAARLSAGTDTTLGALAVAGNVVAQTGNLLSIGTLSGQGVELTGGSVAAGSLTSRGPLSASALAGSLEVATAEGSDVRFAAARDATLGQATATGLLQANGGERLAGTDLRGTTVSLSARNAELTQVVAGAGGLEAAAGESLRLDRATSAGTARAAAGTGATLGTLAATGNVVAQAGSLLTIGTLSGDGVVLTGAAVTGGTVTARGSLTTTARTGDLALGTGQGAEARLAAADDALLGTVSAVAGLEVNAGGQLTATKLRGGTLSVAAREAGIDRAVAGAGGLSVATTAGLRLDQASSGGAARLVAGTDATLGTLDAAGNVVGDAGGALDVRTLSGEDVGLTGATVTAGTIGARGPLVVTARSGNLATTSAQGAEARFNAAGDLALGTVSTTGVLQAAAGGRLAATDLSGGTVTLTSRTAEIATVVAGTGGVEARAQEGLRVDRATSAGMATLAAGTEAALGVVSARGDLSAEAAGRLAVGEASGAGVTLTGGRVEAGKVTAGTALIATSRTGNLVLATANGTTIRVSAAGDAALGSATATGGLQASAGERLTATELRGGTLSASARTIALDRAFAGSGGLEALAGQELRIGQASSAAGARLSGGADVTLGTLGVAGNVAVEAGRTLAVQNVSGAGISLSGNSVEAGRIVTLDALTAAARGGDLRTDRVEAGSARFEAAGNAILGTVTARGDVTATAAGSLGLDTLVGANADLTGRSVSVGQVTVAGLLKVRAGADGLRLPSAAAGLADLESQGSATLGTLTARQDATVDAAVALEVGTVSGVTVMLSGGSVTAGQLGAADLLTARARAGNLGVDRADAARARFDASGDVTLGTVAATGGVTAQAGAALAIGSLSAAEAGLTGRSVAATRAIIDGALTATAGRDGLSLGTVESNSARLTSGGNATLVDGTVAAGLSVEAADTLSAGSLNAAEATLLAASATLGSAAASGTLVVTARSGDVRIDRATAATVALSAAGDAGLGSISSGGQLAVRSGGVLSADRIEGGDVTLDVGSATLNRVSSRGALGMAVTGRLAWTEASAGGSATIAGGEIAATTLTTGGVLTATAAGDLRMGTANSGSQLTLGSGGALAVESLRAAGDAALTTTGAATVAGAALVGGAYRVRGTSVALGTVGGTQRQSAREIALEGNIASLLGATTLAASGPVSVTATDGAGTIAFAPDSLVQAATVQLSAAGRADLGGVAATGGLTVSAADLGLARTVSGATVRLTNNGERGGTRLGGASDANAAEFQAAGNGFDLDGAEIGLVQTADLAIAGGARDTVIGALTVGDATGSQRLSVLTTGRIDVLGRVAVQGVGGAGVRQVTLGGSGAGASTAARSSVVRVAATQDGGGRLLMGTTALTINGDRIGVGLDRDFLDTIGFRAAGLSVEQVTRDYVARPTSTLYNAGGLGAAPYSDGTLLQAHSLSLGYSRYALIQNTAPAGEQRGAILGVLGQTPATPTLSLRVNDANNTFALFGTIDGISSSAAALLGGDRISLGSGVSPLGSRVNGCVIGSGGGCLTASIAQPAINLFNTSRAEVVRSADDLSLPFDPLVGTNNESLYLDPAQEAARSSRADCNEDDAQCRPVS